MDIFKTIKRKITKVVNKVQNTYSMDSKEHRETQVRHDFEFAKLNRNAQDQKWIEFDNYYHNKHKTSMISAVLATNGDIPFELPTLTDAYIQVESQIDPLVPSFQFRGRDGDTDQVKAKKREDIVNYICYNNKLERLNVDNERYLNKLGNGFWKVSWDADVKGMGYMGEILIGNPSPAHIFPDPAAYEVDDCEYIDYAYRIHKRKARRKWGKIVDEISGSASHSETEIFEDRNRSIDDETYQVIEHWYRDDEGDIACSIQVENVEVQFIEKFWEKTRQSGNQRYPFVKYCKVPLDQSFWDKSEIEVIKDLVDAADLLFLNSLLNELYLGNDMTLYEENAIKEGYTIKGVPGEMVPMKDNKIDKIRRLGGVANSTNALQLKEFVSNKIEETTGNASSQSGIEPTRVTTASGIAQLNERADKRKNIKKFDRNEGFEELYCLLDWMALEFYDENRTIMIRGKNKEEKDRMEIVNSNQFAMQGNEGETWFPSIDVEITTGDGINKSKAFTMEATSEIAKMQITQQNLPLIEELIDLLELPNGDRLKAKIRQGLLMTIEQDMMSSMGNPQNYPQMPQNGGQQPDMVDQIVDSMTPEEMAIFQKKSPEEQAAIVQQLSQEQGVDNVPQPAPTPSAR